MMGKSYKTEPADSPKATLGACQLSDGGGDGAGGSLCKCADFVEGGLAACCSEGVVGIAQSFVSRVVLISVAFER